MLPRYSSRISPPQLFACYCHNKCRVLKLSGHSCQFCRTCTTNISKWQMVSPSMESLQQVFSPMPKQFLARRARARHLTIYPCMGEPSIFLSRIYAKYSQQLKGKLHDKLPDISSSPTATNEPNQSSLQASFDHCYFVTKTMTQTKASICTHLPSSQQNQQWLRPHTKSPTRWTQVRILGGWLRVQSTHCTIESNHYTMIVFFNWKNFKFWAIDSVRFPRWLRL